MMREAFRDPKQIQKDRADQEVDRRGFLKMCAMAGPVLLGIVPADADADEDGVLHYGMAIDVEKCIGCGRCAEACKAENGVPREPYFFRTWVERYIIREDDRVDVDSPNGGIEGFPPVEERREKGVLRSFFVPKLCNHCENPPCVQVCPVGATFSTEDGVVLVDGDYCIGCRYCIQACPYGARYLDPETRTAEKCTFCYHRIKQGLLPACVEACPTEARVFGEIGKRSSPLARFVRFHEIHTLKPHLNTEPHVYYANLDGEVS